MTYLHEGASRLTALVTLAAALAAPAAHAAEGPTEDSLWYYEIGGAEPVSAPANPSVVSVTLGGSAQLGLGYSCAKFDPVLAVTNILNDVKSGVDAMMNAMTAAASSAIAALPDGEYTAEGTIDDDGLGNGPVPVRLRLTVAGNGMQIDLAGSAAQAAGPVNCGLTQTVAAARVAYKLLICSDVSPNGGSFRALDVSAPEASIFNAQEPAPCGWYFTPLGLLIDLIVKALAPVMPERAAGAHYGDSMVITIAGTDPRQNHARYLMIEPTTGGWGAFDGGDGASSLINNVNGSFKDLPIEIFESKYPLRILEYSIRQDSGGAGRYRGGNGTSRKYRVEADSSLWLWFERSDTPAWGLFGGGDGEKPVVRIERPGEAPVECLKINDFSLPVGTIIHSLTGGGGGYGDAAERDPEAVREDLLDGFISEEHARSVYGYTG